MYRKDYILPLYWYQTLYKNSFIVQFQCSLLYLINPHLPNGLSHHYHLDKSTFNFRGIRSIFSVFFFFFLPNRLSHHYLWTSTLSILGESGVFFHFYSIFYRNSCKQTCRQRRLWSDWEAQADLTLPGTHSLCWFCHAAAQFVIQCRLIKDFAFCTCKILFWSFGNYRDWSICGEAQDICGDLTLFQVLYFFDPSDFLFYIIILFIFLIFVLKNNDIDILSVIWLQMKWCQCSVCLQIAPPPLSNFLFKNWHNKTIVALVWG